MIAIDGSAGPHSQLMMLGETRSHPAESCDAVQTCADTVCRSPIEMSRGQFSVWCATSIRDGLALSPSNQINQPITETVGTEPIQLATAGN
jgi:hypothetical protein